MGDKTNAEKFKEAWVRYLADDSNYNWQRWNALRQIVFAEGREPDEVEALMNEAEAESKQE
jgi:hypothetical protein